MCVCYIEYLRAHIYIEYLRAHICRIVLTRLYVLPRERVCVCPMKYLRAHIYRVFKGSYM